MQFKPRKKKERKPNYKTGSFFSAIHFGEGFTATRQEKRDEDTAADYTPHWWHYLRYPDRTKEDPQSWTGWMKS
jgi:hypothetical protein